MFKLFLNQKGMAPLVILSLVVLGAFIIWEMTLMFDQQFNTQNPTPNPSPKPSGKICDFADPNDPCDLETGTEFGL